MKQIRFLTLMAIFLLLNKSYGQDNTIFKTFSQNKNQYEWIDFLPNKNISLSQVFTEYKKAFGLTDADQMQLIRMEADRLGITHERYQQYYKGIPVEGSVYLIHSFQGKPKTGNGQLVKDMKGSANPVINKNAAINKAIQLVNAQRYMWEDQANETFIKEVKKDVNASFYPKAELVFINKDFSGDPTKYVLAWKVNVYAEKPLSYQNLYINAMTGELYHKIDLIRTGDVPGTAHTKYSGIQTIITDSISPGLYRLSETGRGGGIITYDMNQGTDYNNAVDFTDADNTWNNVNAQKDEVATDAHFGAEKTYDYYFLKFGRNSFDNAGAPILSYVHYDVSYANAFWDGFRMTYGDGNGTSRGPFTALDVCGHEITHAVTEHTANLIYQNEQGALNEAFSDIFGTAIEFYAVPASGDWLIGEDFDLTTGGNGFRNMSNPNEDSQPDTYKGTYWYTGVVDNGGVHTNSGVANYWFYLLSEGGSGTNDIGNAFSVMGQGIAKAEAIAYRTLTVYLTITSQYIDARLASIQSAIDLYGSCSNEAIATANAWYAVGIGQAVADNDVYISKVLSPVTDCGLTNVPVTVQMIYNGCSNPIPAGEKIYFYYKADGGTTVTDSLILSTNLNGGDTINFTFALQASVPTMGNHTINCWLHYANDTINGNDVLPAYTFMNKLYQNSDVGVKKIISPVSECHMGNMETVTIQVGFFGCEFLPAGNKIPVAYKVNNGPLVYDTITTTVDLYPDTLITHTFSTPANLSGIGNYNISAMTLFDIDSLNTNDALNGYIVKNPFAVSDTTITFDEINTSNNFLIKLATYGRAKVAAVIGNGGTKGFVMTGGNAFSYLDMLEFPDGINTWQINDFLSAKIIFCMDATALSSAFMRFDLKQTYGQQAYELYVGPGDYTVASNLRVLVNDITQISPTYNPTTANGDPFVSRFLDLSPYAGTKFTVTFETRNISADTVIFIMDNAYLDNVKFMQYSDVGIENVDMNDYINLFPNPATDNLQLHFFSLADQSINIEILDLQGKLIKHYDKQAITGQNQYQLDMSGHTAGIYFIRVKTGMGVFNGKIVKQ